MRALATDILAALLEALRTHRNARRAAELVGVNQTTAWRVAKKHGIALISLSEHMKTRRFDPAFIAKQVPAVRDGAGRWLKSQHAKPKFHKKSIEAARRNLTRLNRDPAFREASSERLKRLHEDPGFGAKVEAARQAARKGRQAQLREEAIEAALRTLTRLDDDSAFRLAASERLKRLLEANPSLRAKEAAAPRAARNRGFAIAPILYLLGLIGVGAGVLFSGYSQILRSNQNMSNTLAAKNDLQGTATTLAASSWLSTDQTLLCPPLVGSNSPSTPATKCSSAPGAITVGTSFASAVAAKLPANYASVNSAGSPVEVGVFAAGSGAKVLDPWGHYYIYCRWENSIGTANAIMVISAGADGNLQTNCGSTTAGGDNLFVVWTTAVTQNRAAVWQTTTTGTSVTGAQFGATGTQVDIQSNGNVSIPGTLGVTGATALGTAGLSVAGSTALAGMSASTGTFSGELSGASLNVTGTSTLNGLSAGTSTLSSLAVSNNATVGGTLGVTGTTTLGALTAGTSTLSSLSVTTGPNYLGGNTTTSTGLIQIGTSVPASGVSAPLLTVGKAVSNTYPFTVDQYGDVTGSTFTGSFSGNLTGSQSGGSVSATTLAASGATTLSSTLGVSGVTTLSAQLNGTSAVFSGSVQAGSFVGTMTLGGGGVTISGVVPIANGGTGQTSASAALAALGVTSGGYLYTGLLTSNLIPGGDLVNNSVTSSQLNATGVSAGTYSAVTVGVDGRVTGGTGTGGLVSSINDGSGDSVAVGTTGGIVFDVGSSTVGNWTTTGLMVGSSTPTLDKLDVYGATAIGTGYAGVTAAPTNGLIVQGNVGIGTSNPLGNALDVNGTVNATLFSGSGAGLTNIGTSSLSGTVGTGNGGTGTNTVFTQGSVVFAGVSGVYSQDNANFFYNSTNHSLGLGTTSPQNLLDVNGAASIGYSVAAPSGGLIVSGNVGIGTTSPGNTLDVNGSLTVRTAGGNTIGGTSTNSNVDLDLGGNVTAPVNAIGLYTGNLTLSPASGDNAYEEFLGATVATGGNTIGYAFGLYISPETKSGGGTVTNAYGLYVPAPTMATNNYSAYFGGNVGIGTATPQSKLHIQAGEVQVGSSGASCAAANAGAIRYSGGILYYCDNASIWESIDSSSETDTGSSYSGSYYIATGITTSTSGQGIFGGSTTLGSILTGYGSTADVTLENRSNTPALEVLANSTNIYMPGKVGIGTTAPQALFHVYGADALINTLTVGLGSSAAPTNTAIGVSVLAANTTGVLNTGVGYQVFLDNTTGYRNDAFGYQTFISNTTGYYNSAFGSASLNANTSGIDNAAHGVSSLTANTTGSRNTAIGFRSLYSNTTGSYNTAVGSFAGTVTTGNYNIDIGYNNTGVTTGTSSIVIGNQLTLASATASGQLDIGNIIFGTGVTGIGTAIAGNIGIGTASPANMLDVNGSLAVGTYAGTASGANNELIVGGNVGIGTASPQSKLHIQAGEVQVGSSGASCAAANAGAIRYATGTLYYCDNTSTWESIDSSGAGNAGDYDEVTQTAPNPTGTSQGYLGASATLGGIVSGEGSTADVTLENRSNTPALEVLGNSTNIYMPGNVGIGTTVPTVPLHLYQNSVNGTGIELQNATTAGSYNYTSFLQAGSTGYSVTNWSNATVLEGTGSGGVVIDGYDGPVIIQYGRSPVLTVSTPGYVGIGTTSPSTALQVVGTVTDTGESVNGSINIANGSAYSYGGVSVITAQPASYNYFFGGAGNQTLTSYHNVAVGRGALASIASNGDNTVVGSVAGGSVTGSYNAIFGMGAGSTITTGGNNTILGAAVANTTLVSGSNNILIGTHSGVDTPANNTSNFLNIGNLIYGTGLASSGPSSSGNVGIGTTSPAARLDVYTSTGIGAIDLGGANGISVPAADSTSLAIGNTALAAITTSGSGDIAIGESALTSNTSGGGNNALGLGALQLTTTGNNNSAFGYFALRWNVTNSDNSAFGYDALGHVTANFNTGIGYDALTTATTGASNTATGSSVLQATTTGSNNTANGTSAMYTNTTGGNNSVYGYQAGYDITTGNQNLILGYYPTTGVGVTTGSSNIMLGYDVRPPSQTANNQLNIGNLIYATGLASGATASTGNVGIGSTAPTAKLNIINAASSIDALDITSNSNVIGGTNTGISMNMTAGQVNQTNTAINIADGGGCCASDATITGLNINLNTRNTVYGVNSVVTKDWSGATLLGSAVAIYGSATTDSSWGYSYGGYFENDATAGTGYGVYIHTTSPTGTVTPLLIQHNSTALLQVNSNGNVGIGTTSPQYLLHVGSSSASGAVAGFQNSADLCTLTPASSTPTWSCSSDVRLKTEIADTGDALALFGSMRVRDFTMKATGERQTGVIAQELMKAHPAMVRMGSNGFLTVDSPNPWMLVKAIQELKADNDNFAVEHLADAKAIDELRREIADLKRRTRLQ
jgi:hypothetical protein